MRLRRITAFEGVEGGTSTQFDAVPTTRRRLFAIALVVPSNSVTNLSAFSRDFPNAQIPQRALDHPAVSLLRTVSISLAYKLSIHRHRQILFGLDPPPEAVILIMAT
jgi:hypothetical protein